MMSALSAVLSTLVGRRRIFGEVSYTECTGQRNDFEVITTVKMETRNPILFCSEFPAICNCGVMAASIHKAFFIEICECFWKNDPLMVKFLKLRSEVFIATLIDALCSHFVILGRRSRKLCVPFLTKNQNFPSCCYCPDRVQNLPGQPQTMYSECSRFHPNGFTFSRVIVERVCLVTVCQPVLKYLGPIDRPPKRAVL